MSATLDVTLDTVVIDVTPVTTVVAVNVTESGATGPTGPAGPSGSGGLSVLDYGATGDGTHDDTAGIVAAIAASVAGDTIHFPNTGHAYRTSAVIDLADHRTYEGEYQEIWPYSPNGISPHPNSIRATSGHTGPAIFRMQGKEITSATLEMSNVRIRNLMLDAVAAPADVIPFFAEGRCRDIELEHVTAASATTAGTGGHGFYFTQGTGSGVAPPRGIRMRSCVAWGNAGDGFWFDRVTDFDLYDLLAVTNHGDAGIHITSPHESVISHSRAVFNDGNGWWIDGSSPSTSNDGWGQFTMLAPATDRNGESGILIENTGVGPISIVAPRLRRDASGGASDDAALKVRGPSGTPTCPVEVIGGQSTVGVNDDGTGTESPPYGLRILDTSRVIVTGGLWWGITKGISFANTNTDLRVTREARFMQGLRSAQIAQSPTPSLTYDTESAGAAATAQAAAIAASQPVDSDLTAIAALSTTSYGRSVLTQADATALRSLAGLGTAATQATTAFDASGAAAAAQTASQPVDSDLTTLAGLTATTNNMIQSVGSAWASRTPTQVKSALAIANTDVSGLGTASTQDVATLDTRYGYPPVDISALGAAAQLTGAEIIPAYQGSGTVGVLAKQLISTPWDVRLGFDGTYLRYYEEFENAAAITTAGPMPGTFLQVGLSGTASGSVAQQWGLELIGGYKTAGVGGLTTGSTTTGRADFEYVCGYAYQRTDVINYMTRVRIPTLSDGTNTFIVRIGFAGSVAAAPTDGLYFEAQSGVTNWQAINRGASTSTATDTGIPASASKYTNLAIVQDGTTVHFYASNDQTHLSEVVTQSTNRPVNTTAITPSVCIQKSAGSTARTVLVDMIECGIPLDRGLTLRV